MRSLRPRKTIATLLTGVAFAAFQGPAHANYRVLVEPEPPKQGRNGMLVFFGKTDPLGDSFVTMFHTEPGIQRCTRTRRVDRPWPLPDRRACINWVWVGQHPSVSFGHINRPGTGRETFVWSSRYRDCPAVTGYYRYRSVAYNTEVITRGGGADGRTSIFSEERSIRCDD